MRPSIRVMGERGPFKTTYGAPAPPHALPDAAYDAAVAAAGGATFPSEPPFTDGCSRRSTAAACGQGAGTPA